MIKYLSIEKASLILEVCTKTLRRWNNSGKLKCSYKTIGNQRRYLLQNKNRLN